MSDLAPEKKSGVLRLIIVLLCIAAAGMSIWLTQQKLTGKIDSLAGCGAGSGCANVLGSKWSVVFQVVPVSVFSALLYIGVLASLWVKVRPAGWFRVFAALLMIGAAIWFTLLQLVVMKTICPYCMGMHSVGVVLAICLIVYEGKPPSWGATYASAAAAALACIVGLAALQYRSEGPETHRVDSGDGIGGNQAGADSGETATHAHTRGKGRLVEFFEGRKSYRLDELPHVGSVDAPHVIVKYYDYTCSACRDMHGDLKKLQKKYGGKLTVIVLPVPLERACNSHLPIGVKDHQNACAFARLSLRVWFADRTKFAEFHSWLFEYHSQPLEVAEAMAYNLVGEEKMESVSVERVNQLLAANVEDYRELVRQTPVMPKILLKGSMIMQGVTRDTATFEAVLKKHLQLGE